MTVNISLPSNMYHDMKETIKERGYSSFSELVRDAVRKILYPDLTENGFTPEFEELVLESAKEPIEKGILLKTDKDIENYFKYLKYPISHKKVNG